MNKCGRAKFTVRETLVSVVHIIAGIIMLTPIYYLVVTTFKSPEEATKSPLGLPSNPTFDNYIRALDAMNYGHSLANNLVIASFSVTLLIIFASMGAYAIARSRKKIFKNFFSLFMIGLIIPFQVAIIPLYKIVSAFHLMDTLQGVIIINVFCINLSLSLFLFKGFINTVPAELEEAAFIDGCGVIRAFWLIVFPLLKPVVATVAILSALAIWNDFLTPLLFLQSPDNLVLLQQVYRNVGPFATNWTSFFPMLVLATLPLAIFYLLMQKNIVEGVVAGSVKG